MKNILTLLFATTTLAVFAQPTINSSVFPVGGQTITQTLLDTTGLVQGNSGANQSWNFAAAVSNGGTTTQNYVNAAGTPYASFYPAATVAIDASNGSGSSYSYYQTTSGSTQFLGSYMTDGTNNYNFNYTDPQTVLTYPFTYNSTFTDLFARVLTLTVSGVTLEMHQFGSVTGIGDAYGTITTPAGVYSNTLRLKTITNTTDSNVYVGIPVPADVSYSQTTNYSWISNSAGGVVFSIALDTTNDGSGNIDYGKNAFYTTTSTGLHENNLLTEIGSYPNPTKDFSILSYTPGKTGNALVEVLDNSGKRIAYWNIEAVAEQHQQIRIKLLSEPAGLYQVRIVQGNDLFTSRIMKL